MKIKNITLPKTATLAPMAGVGDRAFRTLCKSFGAALSVGEMVSAKGIVYENEKSLHLLQVTDAERPFATQLFGNEPDVMAEAVKIAESYGPDIIDINMGCPAPKIADNGSGSALMKNPKLAAQIVKAAVDSTKLPVTVKFRSGWDDQSVNAVEFAKRMEQSGASMLTVHGRTRTQMYSGRVNPQIIAEVVAAVGIPVIANGDVCDVESAKYLYENTGAGLVAIGRGALGAPWIFKSISHYFLTGELLAEPTVAEKMDILRRHLELALTFKREDIAMREMRTHTAHYMRGLSGAPKLRAATSSLTVAEDLERLIALVLELNPQ